MPTDDNSMRMNTDRSSEILSDIINRLDRSLGSIDSTMKDIGKVVKDVQSNVSDNRGNHHDRDTNDLLREIKKIGRDVNSFSDGLDGNIGEQKKTLKAIQNSTKENESDLAKYLREQQKVLTENRLKETESIKKEYNDRMRAINQLHDEKISNLVQQLNEITTKINDSNTSDNDRKDAKNKEKELQDILKNLLSAKKYDVEVVQSDADDQLRVLNRKVREQEERISQQSDLEDLIGNMNSRLAQMSPYFSRLQPEKSDADQKREFFEEQLNILEKAKKEIDDTIRENRDLNDKELENLERQRKAIDEQQKMIKQWNPTKEALTKAGKSLLEAGKSIFKTFAGSVFGTLEDKYLMSYKEGFSNVYNSVEQTRNTVSARLKMDQGDFTNLQDRIQDRIYEAGMESVISEVDVNDAIVALSGAGVTNEKVLEELALQQAELKASGSSLDLANEETLNMIRQFLNQQQNVYEKSLEDSLDSLHNILQAQAGAQTMQQENGWDSALIAGGANTQFNQTLNRSLLGQKSEKEIMDDIVASYSYADYLNSLGLDENILQQYLKDITDNSISNLSEFEKILVTNSGLSREAILNMPDQEAYDIILNSLEKILSQTANGDTQYIQEINEAFGTGLTSEDLIRLMHNTIERPIVSTQEAMDAQSKNLQEANTYYSATATHQKETENELGKIANEAEQYYKGNNYVEAGFNAVETGINSLIDIGTELVFGIAKGYGPNILGSSVGSSVGAGGAAGSAGATSAGMLGTIGTAAAGFAIDAALIASAYEFIGKPLRESIENELDPFAQVAEDFKNMTTESISEEEESLRKSNEKLSEYYEMMEENNIAEMKLELIKKKNIDTSQKSEEEIQKLFMENLLQEEENNKKQAELQMQLKNTLLLHANDVSATVKDYSNMAFYQTGRNWEDLTPKEQDEFVNRNLIQFQGSLTSRTISDIGQQMEEVSSKTGDELDLYLTQQGVSKQELSHMSEEQKQKKAAEKYASDYAKSAGFENESKALFEKTMQEYDKRKSIYDEANEEFATQWDTAAKAAANETNGEADVHAVMTKYLEMYHKDDNQQDFLNKTHIRLDEATNSAYLDPGDIYRYNYVFKTGLTNVPYNNYPALLHEGERVLTAEEAEAYNEMSSYAVSNMVNQNKTYGNSSNNVFNTNTYGPTDFERSINNQTNSLNSTLNQILGVLRSMMNSSSYSGQNAGFRNAIKGNSNLGQLNTV